MLTEAILSQPSIRPHGWRCVIRWMVVMGWMGVVAWMFGPARSHAGEPDKKGEHAFPIPKMKSIANEVPPLRYRNVGNQIPNYTPSKKWGTQGEPLNRMQEPLSAQESMQHLSVPEGFHVELFVAEPDLGGKPICMTWDARGRLWVAETYDYPNELQPKGAGRDRIRICEDTNGDGRADQFTVFCEGLSIPTAIAFHRGSVIVQNGTETLLLRDEDGDDRADQRSTLISGWELGDTHGGVSNFQYGLDNWIWAMQGYNHSLPVIKDQPTQRFRMGFFRFHPESSRLEFIRSTNNNTWGLGFSEEGLVFGSTANGCPSVYMPIANRYYERVLGWKPSLVLDSIADSNRFAPITSHVRQVDHHGGYTAGAGHALYTGRQYPKDYWNRTAFVCGPTGHLVGTFVLEQDGSGFRSSSPFNLLASRDEWTAPIMAEVGPDGQVWVLDWYNYIVQHNPTPQGFETGKGRAYETQLRDKTRGRIYRVVCDGTQPAVVPNLELASAEELVQHLSHPTMLVRKHAQRLLVERGNPDVQSRLLDMVRDASVDEIGLNVGSIHALWTLHGLGVIKNWNGDSSLALRSALRHPSAGVRLNAVQVLPRDTQTAIELLQAKCHLDEDAHVRKATLLAFADLNESGEVASACVDVLQDSAAMADPWMPDALTSAACAHDTEFLLRLAKALPLTRNALDVVRRVTSHHIRSHRQSHPADVLVPFVDADPFITAAVLDGILDAATKAPLDPLSKYVDAALVRVSERLIDENRIALTKLALSWGSPGFERVAKQFETQLWETVRKAGASDESRSQAAGHLVSLFPQRLDVVQQLLKEVGPNHPPDHSAAMLATILESEAVGVDGLVLQKMKYLTPSVRDVVTAKMLQSQGSVITLLMAAENRRFAIHDLPLVQQQALLNFPREGVRTRAKRLLEAKGALPSVDRQGVLDRYVEATRTSGDVTRGREVFKTHCSKCHIHGEMGTKVGPNLTGMAVHPKAELLTHVLDPNRDVEGNFRAYRLLTVDGQVLTGMLASESKTAVELFDTEGKRQSILREDIEEWEMSNQSVMPEGFESAISVEAMTDLLSFLTAKDRFVPLDLRSQATAISTMGLFSDRKDGPDRLVMKDWGVQSFHGVPFLLVDPGKNEQPNVILMHGPRGTLPPKMPRNVSLPCRTIATKIHLLSGVGGWCFPAEQDRVAVLDVRLHYVDGTSEDHPLLNGVHFADYIRRVDVSGSQFAVSMGDQQMRYLAIQPRRPIEVETIEFIKPEHVSAPIVMAVTLETDPENGLAGHQND